MMTESASTGPASTGPASARPASTRSAGTGPAGTGPASTGPAKTGSASTASMTADLSGALWRKAAGSYANAGCVQVATNLPGIIAVRDSARPADGAHVVEPSAFAALLADLKRGRYDI